MTKHNQTCPVCDATCTEAATKCETCGFADALGIAARWIDSAEGEDWIRNVVKPYRRDWQLQVLLEQNAELLARLGKLEAEVGQLRSELATGGTPAPEHITIKGEQYSTSLTSLNLEQKGLSCADIVPLRFMTSLTMLRLRRNQISDLAPLSGLKNLSRLDLAYNKISDITPLSGLKNLNRLDLSYNQISDLAPLSDLKNLNRLDLSYNQISDISPLLGLRNLEYLVLQGNPISENRLRVLKKRSNLELLVD